MLVLNEEFENLKEENYKLKIEVLELKNKVNGLEIALDYIKEFNKNVNNNRQNFNIDTSNVEKEKTQKVDKKKDQYEALLEFQAKQNKREILKEKVLTMIRDNGISLAELLFLFVEHHRYTSKATFYNYLKELEYEERIKIERSRTKNFVYKMTHKLLKTEI
jgi:hypothetical protein